MDRLRCLQVFSEAARCRSFVRAAWQLSLSKGTVTKQVAWLETSVGSQLLNRNNKQVTVTEAGARVLEAAQELLERYERLEADVRESVHLPRGTIRVGTPPAFGIHQLMPVVSRFTARYPDIEVTVILDDGRTDLVAAALDLSIRIAPKLEDVAYIAYPLMKAPQVLVASPAYLKRAGMPTTVKDLHRHNCLVHTIKSSAGYWRFAGDPPEDVRVRGTVRSNIGEALKQAALLGCGIALHPHYMVSEELRSGALQVVLPDLTPQELDIFAVFSTRRNMPVRVRALLEFLKEWAINPPDWSQSSSVANRQAPALMSVPAPAMVSLPGSVAAKVRPRKRVAVTRP